jgi:biotin synthase
VDWVCGLLSALDADGEVGSAIVLSLGERDEAYYERLRACGARRYILNHKTASPILYNELHPERDYFDRLQCMRSLLGLEFRVGTSVSVGLPHQDLWDLTDDIMQARELGLDAVIVGPFVPGSLSPLSGSPRGSIQRSLTSIAVARLVLRDIAIPGGLSLGHLDAGSTVEALRWGASAIICELDGGGCPEADLSASVALMGDAMTTRIRSLGRRLGELRPNP